MAYNFSSAKEEFKKIEERLTKDYSGLHTGRATPAVLDGVYVEAYGSKMPINAVASIGIEDPKTLRVTPWDSSVLKDIERGIQSAQLGLSVSTDDAGLRVIFPMLTTETRQKLVKVLKERLEDTRILVRKSRETTWDDIQAQEKDGKMSEDDKFRAKDELQKHVDDINNRLEEIFKKKEKEVLEN
jgi:ribosome recycling factor